MAGYFLVKEEAAPGGNVDGLDFFHCSITACLFTCKKHFLLPFFYSCALRGEPKPERAHHQLPEGEPHMRSWGEEETEAKGAEKEPWKAKPGVRGCHSLFCSSHNRVFENNA